MRHHGGAVLAADVEHQPVAGNRDVQGERPVIGSIRREQVLFDEVVDRDGALVLDIGTGTPNRFLIQRHRDDAIVGIFLWRRFGHDRLRRNPTERAWASRPSALPSVISAGPNARNWSGPHFRIDVRFMKSSTPSPEENRADCAVGSTWLEPPTESAIASGVWGPRKIAPALGISAATLSGSEVMISRCSAAMAFASSIASSSFFTRMMAPNSFHEARAISARGRVASCAATARSTSSASAALSVIRIDCALTSCSACASRSAAIQAALPVPSAMTSTSEGPAIMSMPTLPNTSRLAAAT